MIIELTRYEPDDGRQYESPLGGEVSAIERVRLDCVACWYTKVKEHALDRMLVFVNTLFDQYGAAPEVLSHQDVADRQWFEAIYVQYRHAGETKVRALLGIGYELRLFGAQQRPDQLIATLGPRVIMTKEQYANKDE